MRSFPEIGPTRDQVNKLLGARESLLTQQEQALRLLGRLQHDEEVLGQCNQLCEQLTVSLKGRVSEVISPICGAALRDVFGPTYDFVVESLQQPSGKCVSRLVATDGELRGNPMKVRGGSVVSILSLFLPIAISVLRPEAVQPFFILDEPLGALSGEPLRAVAETLKQVSSDEDNPLQVVIVSQLTEGVWEDLADVQVHLKKNRSGKINVETKRLEPAVMEEEL